MATSWRARALSGVAGSSLAVLFPHSLPNGAPWQTGGAFCCHATRRYIQSAIPFLDRKWRYRFDPSKHGISPTNRGGGKTFRFCYEVLPGFHYDVSDDHGGWFTVDVDGKRERLKHCNVTPWGLVRQG
jgi:hypothetical protein